MMNTSNIPYDWSEIETQLRDAIIAMASILQTFGPEDGGSTVENFLGLPVEMAGLEWMSEEEIEGVDPTRHAIYGHARAAWCYAYQQDGLGRFTAETAHELACGLLSGGYAMSDSQSEPTGLDDKNDFALRRVLETAVARWDWSVNGCELTVRQLSLLSNMAEATVRSSLSKEGFRLDPPNTSDKDKSAYTLSSSDARQWLMRRRGFIPNADETAGESESCETHEALSDLSIPFPVAVQMAFESVELSGADGLKVHEDWFDGLTKGKPVAPDLNALIALADALGAPRADFAARGVKYLLELQET
ncbi:hypothetical protein [Roseovarius nubinhibens]|uniref:Uncharacterized protein n=1 Tax=Roseovarius nubinhibens TaxID=314263 RepID=A0A348WB17_9RHOB|nr:hypothetical protein [Roseovarius nubinhibens]|tara:strand:+ start:1399 stop:2310 length:912 start_codon:yes stop_codon:yes gene_type:complete